MARRCLFAIGIVCSFFCWFSPLGSQTLIKEANDFSTVLDHLEKDTLFVFDLDNTLIETVQHLGSDQWVCHQVDRFVKEGLSWEEAFEKVLPQYIAVQNRSEVRLVDPTIPDLLRRMQRKRIFTIGLTKREPVLLERTLKQISSLQIDFSKTAQFEQDLVFEELRGTTYKKGIIFIGHGIEKGPALVAYLNKLKKIPKKIVVIDDKMNNIINIAQALKAFKADFIGLRYGGADEKVKSFNPKIADLQWEHFQKILSDEQASHLLQMNH